MQMKPAFNTLAETFGAEVDDLDDEAIERSIAEINEAIRRSASRKG
jgi:hypothetical protein